MKFARRYFILVAFITLGLGTALLLFPRFTSGIFFDNLNNQTLFFVRICGSTLLGYAALNWFSAKSNNSEILKVSAWGNLVTLLIATAVSLLAIPEFDHNIWLLSAQHAAFSAGFIYCLLKLK